MCKHGKAQHSISTVQGFVPKLCGALQTLSGIGMMSLMSDIGEQHAMQNAKIDCALQAVIQDHLWKLETLWNSWKKSRLVCVIQNSIDFGSNLPNNPEGPESFFNRIAKWWASPGHSDGLTSRFPEPAEWMQFTTHNAMTCTAGWYQRHDTSSSILEDPFEKTL